MKRIFLSTLSILICFLISSVASFPQHPNAINNNFVGNQPVAAQQQQPGSQIQNTFVQPNNQPVDQAQGPIQQQPGSHIENTFGQPNSQPAPQVVHQSAPPQQPHGTIVNHFPNQPAQPSTVQHYPQSTIISHYGPQGGQPAPVQYAAPQQPVQYAAPHQPVQYAAHQQPVQYAAPHYPRAGPAQGPGCQCYNGVCNSCAIGK